MLLLSLFIRKTAQKKQVVMAESEMIQSTDSNFFEGVEKLLEIRFQRNAENKNADLRLIPR